MHLNGIHHAQHDGDPHTLTHRRKQLGSLVRNQIAILAWYADIPEQGVSPIRLEALSKILAANT